MALSRLHRLLKKSRPLSRSAQQRKLTLEALEDRTVLSFVPAVTIPVGVDPRAVTVADFNNDSKPDLAVVNTGPFSTSQSSLSVLLGNGNGSFQSAVTTNIHNSGPGHGDALGGGGRLQSRRLARRRPEHHRPRRPRGGSPAGQRRWLVPAEPPDRSASARSPSPWRSATSTRNGALDLVTANIQRHRQRAAGQRRRHFQDQGRPGRRRRPAHGRGRRLQRRRQARPGDANYGSNTVSVLLGNGNGTFQRPRSLRPAAWTSFTPSSIAVGDINGDGRPDLVINLIGGEDSVVSQLGVLLGNGDGSFRAPILQNPGSGGDGDVALGDFNNDGRLDAAVGGQAALPDGLTVFNGDGDGTFGVRSSLR